MLTVSMLGRMSVALENRRVALDLGPSGRLMAGYLFQFPGRVVRREYLAEMFWNDRSLAQARAAMNTAVWRLRTLLARAPGQPCDGVLVSSGDEIVFERPAWMEIDTHDFNAAVRDALSGHAGDQFDERMRRLECAAALYTGSFLEGDDGDWVITERERLHSLYVRCLCQLTQLFAAHGEYEPAIDAARRVLVADPFRETVMRSLCILLFLNGQRAQAIGDLTRWQVALRAQVGVDAMPETLALRGALITGAICNEIGDWRRSHLESAASRQNAV
ncbi:BTAD domain-containing putative transcriptional regulator [Variovorax sp. J22R133]|uniref:AfsR/SARP family transcriptional regulator n=1 Tax=Variovorax brevis TaxID=3053503 RepID=UPI0025788F68|nr:BTAD domain-containing putative transcriptional regulator [Variovorax sp. J22R133]MDM0110714.1 BTAD domain-containing putative transcriptional regulator [Variovorax sp. J22R133]